MTFMLVVAAAIAGAVFQRRHLVSLSDNARTLDAFRAQLAEIDREQHDGILDEAAAQAARLEVQRRLLNAQSDPAADANADSAPPPPEMPFDRFSVVATLVAIVGGSIALYAVVGSPEIAASQRGGDLVEALTQAHAPVSNPASASPDNARIASVDDMIAGLRQRLELDPEDVDGWSMLGWALFRTDRYPEAAGAFASAAALLPDSADLRSSWGEAVVMAASGSVTQEAADLFGAALARDPSDERARFYQALALDQSGEPEAAVRAWLSLLDGADPNEGWVINLLPQLRDAADRAGIDVTAELEALSTAVVVRGPTPEDVRAAAEMPDEDRQAMIVSMVESLDAQLTENASDPDRWLRLIRSRVVLGQLDEAQSALQRARVALADDPEALSFIVSGAEELGLAAD